MLDCSDLKFIVFDFLGVQALFSIPILRVCMRWYRIFHDPKLCLPRANYFKNASKIKRLSLSYTIPGAAAFHRQCPRLFELMPNITELRVAFLSLGSDFNPFPFAVGRAPVPPECRPQIRTHFQALASQKLRQALPWRDLHTLLLEKVRLDMRVIALMPQLKHISLTLGSVSAPYYLHTHAIRATEIESFSLKVTSDQDELLNDIAHTLYFAGAKIAIPVNAASKRVVVIFIEQLTRVLFSHRLRRLRLDDFDVNLQRTN